MGDRVGQEFDGSISGVTEFGLYVELTETLCEGMIPLRSLLDDYYEFDERNYCLVGRRYHKCYALGDKVRVKVDRANLERRQLDFALVSDESETMEQRQRAGKNNQDKTKETKPTRKRAAENAEAAANDMAENKSKGAFQPENAGAPACLNAPLSR